MNKLFFILLATTCFNSVVSASKDLREDNQVKNIGKRLHNLTVDYDEERQEYPHKNPRTHEDEPSLQYKEALALWTFAEADGQSVGHNVLKQITQTKGHPHQYTAARTLWYSKDAEDQSIALGAYIQIAQTNGHPSQ